MANEREQKTQMRNPIYTETRLGLARVTVIIEYNENAARKRAHASLTPRCGFHENPVVRSSGFTCFGCFLASTTRTWANRWRAILLILQFAFAFPPYPPHAFHWSFSYFGKRNAL